MLVDRSHVKKIEEGQIPNWVILPALSKVFDEPFKDTLNRLILTIEVQGRPNVPFLLGMIHGYREADYYPMAAEIRKWANPDGQKSPEDDTLDTTDEPGHSGLVMAHRVPSSAFHAAEQSGRSLPPTAASEERLRAIADDLQIQLNRVESLAEILENSIVHLDAGGETGHSGRQSPKQPRDRK